MGNNRVVPDTTGGFHLPDGSRVVADGMGGFHLPDGGRVVPDGMGGFHLPDGGRVVPDTTGGFHLSGGGRATPDGQGGFHVSTGGGGAPLGLGIIILAFWIFSGIYFVFGALIGLPIAVITGCNVGNTTSFCTGLATPVQCIAGVLALLFCYWVISRFKKS